MALRLKERIAPDGRVRGGGDDGQGGGKVIVGADMGIAPEERIPQSIVGPALVPLSGLGQAGQGAMVAQNRVGGIDAGQPPPAQPQA